MYKSYWKLSIGFWLLIFLIGTSSVLYHPFSKMISLIQVYLKSTSDYESVEEIADQISKTQKAKFKLEKDLKEIKSRLFELEKNTRVYEILNKISSGNRIIIEKLLPQPLKPDSLFSIFPVKIGFEAEFHKILKFLTSLESELPGCHITSLEIEKSLVGGEKLGVELVFETYILK